MKKKAQMYFTFKTNLFSEVMTKDNRPAPAVKAIDGHLAINNEYCDLRVIRERYNPATKELTASAVDSILGAESFLTKHYGKRINNKNTLLRKPLMVAGGALELEVNSGYAAAQPYAQLPVRSEGVLACLVRDLTLR